MAQRISVQKVDDPRVDDFRHLSTADRRPDRPGGRGFVIAEGTVVVRRLLASDYPVRALLGVARRIEELEPELAGVDVPAYVTSAELMAEIVGFHLNRGVLAVADRAPRSSAGEIVARARVLAVPEGVGDHENLGALFRNAAAFGLGGVLLGPGCSDPLYRRSVRVSMGNVLRVPFAPLEPWPAGLTSLKEKGFRVAALTPRADSVPLRELAADGGKIALLLGSEGPGLTEEALGAADVAVRVPMAEGVDSLNVATAAAVAFYELAGR
ncbi:RNA methyltransferase [Amycolatopsis acidiphila]|uniref:RNA methyltransferase n=1 Tax=Amycolatopsis acidiphila TaxID=715473 RepID=A0A558AJR5_9PSEU|nr:RNA methyltransferase [Amycolatopsis acidiphila]TVT24502.1 RNA methyltransferase [Amycolatopsis acidiphila]UIJ59287.1 RNA methyltransferase [Amycolatopsis acidiphila]GHG79518.1 tRNA/rRNA methyltransferase [Amycolatopsis acidiphila]